MAEASFKEKPIITVKITYNDLIHIFNLLNDQIITEIGYSHNLFNGKRSLEYKIADYLNITLYVERDGDDAEIGLVFRNTLKNMRVDRVILDHYSLNPFNCNNAKNFESHIIRAFREREKDFDSVIEQIAQGKIGLKFLIEEGVFTN